MEKERMAQYDLVPYFVGGQFNPWDPVPQALPPDMLSDPTIRAIPIAKLCFSVLMFLRAFEQSFARAHSLSPERMLRMLLGRVKGAPFEVLKDLLEQPHVAAMPPQEKYNHVRDTLYGLYAPPDFREAVLTRLESVQQGDTPLEAYITSFTNLYRMLLPSDVLLREAVGLPGADQKSVLLRYFLNGLNATYQQMWATIETSRAASHSTFTQPGAITGDPLAIQHTFMPIRSMPALTLMQAFQLLRQQHRIEAGTGRSAALRKGAMSTPTTGPAHHLTPVFAVQQGGPVGPSHAGTYQHGPAGPTQGQAAHRSKPAYQASSGAKLCFFCNEAGHELVKCPRVAEAPNTFTVAATGRVLEDVHRRVNDRRARLGLPA